MVSLLFVPKVTDDLFEEIATKVLSEDDDMAGEHLIFSIFCQSNFSYFLEACNSKRIFFSSNKKCCNQQLKPVIIALFFITGA